MVTPRVLSFALLAAIPIGCGPESRPAPRKATAQPTTDRREESGQASPGSTSARSSLDADLTSENDKPPEPITPSDLVRRVNELRRAGLLTQMADCVAAEHRAAVLKLVRAVDQLLLDNRVLLDRIKTSAGRSVATLFDRAGLANIIDVFSYDVEVVREQVSGDAAEVTIRVGQRLPLAVVRLIRSDGSWLIEPDPPIPGLAEELRNLGKALQRVAKMVERQEMTVEQIREEIELWQTPVLRRIEDLVEQTRSGQD